MNFPNFCRICKLYGRSVQMSCAFALYMKNHIFVFIGDTLSDQVRVLNLSQNGL